MKLFWTPEAMKDREAIYEYIEADNPVAALDLDELIRDKTNALVEHPKRYKPGRAPGTREMVVHPNYVVIYRETKTEVAILRVLHARQQWPRLSGAK